MAFSYSDENFTVVGNLCFVHIILDGTERMIDIPPAIVERISYYGIICNYPCLSSREARGSGSATIGYAIISGSKISLSDVGEGYLNFCFPIDSNK